jgi:hypothetical protein
MRVFLRRVPTRLAHPTKRDLSHWTSRRDLRWKQNHVDARSVADFARNISPPTIQVAERCHGTRMIETRGDLYWIIACRANACPHANNPAAATIHGVVSHARFAIGRSVAIGKSRWTDLPAPGSLTTLTTLATLARAAPSAIVTWRWVASDEKNHAQRHEIRFAVHWSPSIITDVQRFATGEAQRTFTATPRARQEAKVASAAANGSDPLNFELAHSDELDDERDGNPEQRHGKTPPDARCAEVQTKTENQRKW